jgi:four helix bundle protein
MQDFRKLKVWGKARQLTLEVYRATNDFPRREHGGLVSQMRRASGSIGANIAEGCGRDTRCDLGRFLQIAIASASELENHLILARDLDVLSARTYRDLSERTSEVLRMLFALLRRIRDVD